MGLLAALSGGFLLAVAAARWIEGVTSQALARASLPAPRQVAPREASELPSLPIQKWNSDTPELEEVPAPVPPAPGEVVGRVRIPRLGIDLAVFEGVSADILRKGPGHVPGTALPTAGPNCVITAHRDSFFRPLARAKVGDAVFVSGGDGGEREYRLASRRVVDPTEVAILDPTAEEQLTLLTCYPFRFIGPAPYRLVWQALPVDAFARREERPASESR